MAKVLLLADFDSYGGTRTYFERLVEFYSSAGHQLVVAATRDQVDQPFLALAERAGVRHVVLPDRVPHLGRIWHRLPFSVLFELYALLPVIRGERPDLLVISSAVPSHYLGMLMLPLPVLYIAHTVPSGTSKSQVERWAFSRFLGPRKRLLAVSEFAKRQMHAFWVPDSRSGYVNVLHNPATADLARPGADADRSAAAHRVLTVGHLRAYKNPFVWIDVAQKVKESADTEVEFVWAGDGDLLADCVREVERRRLKNVWFAGFRSDVDTMYSTSSVYLHPSLLENHSLAVLDAMAWGLPCVVAKTGGLPESVVDGVTGYVVDPNDADAFAERVLQLVRDADLRRRMGEAARDHCETSFSLARWREAMIDLHESILSNV
jgi:glycosyltransferase involved in cell wall biosynthesis